MAARLFLIQLHKGWLVLLTVTQFILVLKIFYVNYNIFQPLAMLLYVFGQYLLYLFVILEEKKRKRYHIINKANSAA